MLTWNVGTSSSHDAGEFEQYVIYVDRFVSEQELGVCGGEDLETRRMYEEMSRGTQARGRQI